MTRPTEHGSLRARGIVQRFGDRTVLEGVDLDVPAGRIVGLLGPNGAGKTTLMRVLFGVVTPDAGEVTWEGRPVTARDRRSWGYMPQERGLYRDMRVLDLLVFFGRLHGVEKQEAARRADALLEQLGLGDRRRDDVKDLSGGMAQRVQLAAAMVHGPRLLVLDEPFAGLDPVASNFLARVVQEHVRSGHHLLFSSHQLDLVEDLCDTITLINRGRVVLQGDVRVLKRDSPERFLRVDSDVDAHWVQRFGAEVASRDASGTRLRLRPGTEAVAVLDAVRAHAAVTDFAVEAPTLSDLFLAAAGEAVEYDAAGNVQAREAS
jgi:ABC-2 type transport system ATP-binding protein